MLHEDTGSPYYKNLDTCINDAKVMRSALAKYRISDEDKEFDLTKNPTFAQVSAVFKEIKHKMLEGLMKKPKKINYVVFLLFAGHGILKDGMQTLVINEYDNLTAFYKLFPAEEAVRKLSYSLNMNSYFICSFACCRELFNPNIMKGCFDANKPISKSEVLLIKNRATLTPNDEA